jgi:type II secretory pathway pseudopilin PulG
MTNSKNKKLLAFSLIELSIVVLIIGILIAGITQGSRLIQQSKIKTAQNQTTNSPVNSIPDLNLWLETTLDGSVISATNGNAPENGDLISADLRTAVYTAVLAGANEELVDQIIQLHDKCDFQEEKVRLACALGVVKDKKLIETYKQQDKDLRLLTYKILVETFNKKYTNLDDSQKNLLKEYINNISNTTKFINYVGKELPNIIAELNIIKSKLKDRVTQIKLSETISLLEKMKIGKTVSDSQVSSIMLSYELIKELKSKVK